jgi:hypothetical protein
MDTSDIYKVRPVAYESIYDIETAKDGDVIPTKIGFIAEECEEANPYFSWNNSEGGVEGLDWFNMLTATIAELQKLKMDFENYKKGHP